MTTANTRAFPALVNTSDIVLRLLVLPRLYARSTQAQEWRDEPASPLITVLVYYANFEGYRNVPKVLLGQALR